jgi:uncharacterized cupredoxin-like copper-binding protein
MYRFATVTLLVVAAVGLVACGDDDGEAAADVDRAIEIDMVDIAFEPAALEVTAGETVRFVFTNQGDVAHDAFIGDADAQDDHADDMADGHDGGHGDDAAGGITVEPGESAELVHAFAAEDDEVLIGCHQPGHYDAGMVTTIQLT